MGRMCVPFFDFAFVSRCSPILQTIVNLAEQQGREAVITQKYREYAVEFNDKDVQ
jgi:mRNA degradation ribonuclease J1/J2